MYTDTYKGMTLTLPDEDYEILKRRLMVSKAIRYLDEYSIREPCICNKYTNCDGCPFDLIGQCRRYFEAFDGQGIVMFLTVEINWHSTLDKEARAIIKSMRHALLSMTFVKESDERQSK